MAEANRADSEIFDGGPPLRLEKSLGLIKPDQRRSVQRALLAVLIVWAPLFVLSAIESLVLKENKLGSLIGDLTVLSRYLIVVPLFILAEAGTIFRLGQITRHFIDAGIITAADRPRFDRDSCPGSQTPRFRHMLPAGCNLLGCPCAPFYS